VSGFLQRRREQRQERAEQRQQQEEAEQQVFAYAEQALADDIITEQEEDHLVDLVVAATGSPNIALESKFHEVGRRILIAKANAGRLPEVEDPEVMAKPGEIVHAEVGAALKKEVTLSHREFKGGGAGVSFRVAKGVRVRYGGGRGSGYTVYDGTAVVTEDTGILSITSKRLVFMGSRKTFEVLYTKLAGLTVYQNGLAVSATNRQRVLTFEGFDGPVVAAYISAAAAAQYSS
jgi:hypothetical protein